jgi:hypothetical protein
MDEHEGLLKFIFNFLVETLSMPLFVSCMHCPVQAVLLLSQAVSTYS